MPIYEFRCAHYDKNFELLAAQSDDLIAPLCPSCRSPEISRVLPKLMWEVLQRMGNHFLG